ncbi:caspase family protein [uncultured Spirosoma sp.]|uniref:caspase family protein n=1 Tax=uncultured Spirosoma sp. TaxID=278208 RepID=UPI002589706E|nr:caspase family protein [uncultured Spirosoma sp.]
MNIAYLTEMADSVCRRTGLKRRMIVYEGNEFRAGRCDQVLTSLRPEPDDVVFFYFMGHGWNNSETEEPMLLFKTEGQSPGMANSRNLKAIYEQLRRKGNRLILVFGESCNSAINDRSRAKKGSGVVMNVSVFSAEQLRNLFLRSRMTVLLHTCKRNQKSNSSEDGGWFFTSFLDQFKQATAANSRQPARWESLLSASAKATAAYAHEQGAVQEPVFRIETQAVVASGRQTKPPATASELVSTSVQKEANRPEVTTPAGGNVCDINRTAFNAVRSHLSYLEAFRAKVTKMNSEEAADEFRHYYSPDRQVFFQQLAQKLNVTQLEPAEAAWFADVGKETSELLEETAYYLDDPHFRNNAYSKLAVPIDNMRSMVDRLQNLLRRCRN